VHFQGEAMKKWILLSGVTLFTLLVLAYAAAPAEAG
jgi:hypothetical protein